MLIGNRYADNKLYRGIKHYDSLPLTSGDLHEYADILQMKNALFMNNIIGSGTLNEPGCRISSTGISLDSPSVVLIDGDISLVNADPDPLVTTEEISTAGYSHGLVCIVGWYQSLTASSTMRSYGGVRNKEIANELLDNAFKVQVSTRYQLRWDVVIVDADSYSAGNSIQFNLMNRDETGAVTTGTTALTIPASTDTVKIVTKPQDMTYAVSDLYIVPIVEYDYSSGAVSDAKAYRSVKPISSYNFLKSTTEPTDSDLDNGAIWYNPDTCKFKFYVAGVGFVPTASDLALIQYNNTTTISTQNTSPTDIQIDIGISSYSEDDILQVLYNGAVLTQDLHYTVDSSTKKITILQATTEVGDEVTVVAIKLVDSSTATSITSEFRSHIASYGSSTVKGHVSLSDASNPTLGVEKGVAVTPKALYDATVLTDTTTGKKYKLRVQNGVLGIVEV